MFRSFYNFLSDFKKLYQFWNFEIRNVQTVFVIFVLTVTRIIFFYIRVPTLSWYINGAVKLMVDVK